MFYECNKHNYPDLSIAGISKLPVHKQPVDSFNQNYFAKFFRLNRICFWAACRAAYISIYLIFIDLQKRGDAIMKAFIYGFIFTVLFSGWMLTDTSGDEGYIYKEVTIDEGQTIYGEIAKVASNRDNINEVTALACRENNIKASDLGAIQPGTKLMVRLKAPKD